MYVLVGRDGRPYRSETPGVLGGHRRGRLYGRLDCPSALRAVALGGYVKHRVFFADAATAIAAGYRPCAVCLPERHRDLEVAAEHRALVVAVCVKRYPERRSTVYEHAAEIQKRFSDRDFSDRQRGRESLPGPLPVQHHGRRPRPGLRPFPDAVEDTEDED